MLDLIMNMMSNVTEKLAAIDERITGLASKIEVTPANPAKRGIADTDEALFASPTNMTAVIQEGGNSNSQVFLDTAVALKPLATPARAKKQNPTLDLDITPLNYETTSRAQATSAVSAPTQVETDSVTQNPANVGVSWTLPTKPTPQLPIDNVISNEEVTAQD